MHDINKDSIEFVSSYFFFLDFSAGVWSYVSGIVCQTNSEIGHLQFLTIINMLANGNITCFNEEAIYVYSTCICLVCVCLCLYGHVCLTDQSF